MHGALCKKTCVKKAGIDQQRQAKKSTAGFQDEARSFCFTATRIISRAWLDVTEQSTLLEAAVEHANRNILNSAGKAFD